MSVLVMLLALVMPPCASEDSQNCYWDAAHLDGSVCRQANRHARLHRLDVVTRGNGVGTSFVDLGGFIIYAEGN